MTPPDSAVIHWVLPGRPWQRRRLAARRLGVAVAAISAVLALSACTVGQRAPDASGGRVQTSQGKPRLGPDAKPGPGQAGQQTRGPAAFCATRPAVGVTAALSRALGASLRAEVVPFGVSADGRTAYVSTWAPGFSGVAALSLASGALHPIRRFRRPATDQADGAWGGRWLVWDETYSLQSLDDFTVFGWDAATGRLMRLGRSLRSPAGIPWPSPWHAPAVSGDQAAWAQGYGPGGVVEIRLADLRTGRVIVIRKGHVQAPFFDGSLVVWPESDSPGSSTTLRAYDPASGRLVPLPPVLRAVRGTDFVATDGTKTAYLSPDLTRLYYSPAPDLAAKVVLRLPPGVDFAYLEIGPGTLAWTTTQATYLASTRTGGYARVTPQYGFAVTGPGPAVLISDGPTSKSAHPILALHVLDGSAPGWPGCAGRTGRPG